MLRFRLLQKLLQSVESVSASQSKNSTETGAPDRVRQPTQADWKLIEQWVLIGGAFGIPRSVCHIYGFMFVASVPLSAKDCVECLLLSRSSAGQGIKLLLELGAIKPVFEIGKREESYVIEPDLGVLIKKLLEGRFMPSLEQFLGGLDEIREIAEQENNQHLIERLDKLSRWQSRVAPFKIWLDKQL